MQLHDIVIIFKQTSQLWITGILGFFQSHGVISGRMHGAISDPQGALSAIENVVLFDLIEGTLKKKAQGKH